MNLNKIKVVKVGAEQIEFECGVILYSNHERNCCEGHYLSFKDLKLDDFDGLEFDLTTDDFFKKINDYGIELIPINGYSVKVPGYGSNNGYYSTDLQLCVTGAGIDKEWDITECQEISD